MAEQRAVTLSSEVDLMDLLWRNDPLTLAEAHQAWRTRPMVSTELAIPPCKTTMQTRLNRLVSQGLARKSATRPATYSPRAPREAAQAGQLDDVLTRLANGSVVPLVRHLVRSRRISRDDLLQLKRIVEQAEQELLEN